MALGPCLRLTLNIHVAIACLLQLYDRDFLNGGVQFKVEGIGQEIEQSGEKRYTTYMTFESMFHEPEAEAPEVSNR